MEKRSADEAGSALKTPRSSQNLVQRSSSSAGSNALGGGDNWMGYYALTAARFPVLALSSFARCPPLAGSLRTGLAPLAGGGEAPSSTAG